MGTSKPFMVGIAGVSCSGKTTVALELLRTNPKSALISFDDYIYSSKEIDYSKVSDWESPRLYKLGALKKDLVKLKKGETITYSTHSRKSSIENIIAKTAKSKPLIIVEGFLLFYDLGVREQLDLRIFLDLPEEEILRRRFARRTEKDYWDHEVYIRNLLLKGQKRYVFPTKLYAHHVIDATKPKEEIINEVSHLITAF